MHAEIGEILDRVRDWSAESCGVSALKTPRVLSTFMVECRVAIFGATMMIWGSIFPITVPRTLWEKEAEKYLYEASAFLHFGLQDPSLIDIELSSKKKCYNPGSR